LEVISNSLRELKHSRPMASSPHQRPSRSPDAPPLVDPQTVAAVRRITLRCVEAVSSSSRSVGRASLIAIRWLGPRVAALALALGGGVWRAAAGLCGWLWRERTGVGRTLLRGIWWGALAILVWVGQALLSPVGDPELIGSALLWFGAGLAMSVLVLIGAPELRMRMAAFALASGHGTLAALTWLVVSGA
jgi:hypothetical protein